MTDTTLAQRIQRLEDLEAIRQLKALYGKCADDKYTDDHKRKPPQELARVAKIQASVFTEDAVWDGGQFGVHAGRPAIENYLANVPWTFAMHYYLSPHILLNGDSATGEWMLWQTATFADDNLCVFMSGKTYDEYLRTHEGWRIKRTNFVVKFVTPFDQPWSVNRNGPIKR